MVDLDNPKMLKKRLTGGSNVASGANIANNYHIKIHTIDCGAEKIFIFLFTYVVIDTNILWHALQKKNVLLHANRWPINYIPWQ